MADCSLWCTVKAQSRRTLLDVFPENGEAKTPRASVAWAHFEAELCTASAMPSPRPYTATGAFIAAWD